MPLFDRVKAQAADLSKKAQEAGRAGQAKLDDLQAKRRIDALYRDLGAAVYADRSGEGTDATAAEIDRLIGAISLERASQAAGDSTDDDTADTGEGATSE